MRKPNSLDYLIAGDSEVLIEGYGRVDVPIIRPDGTKGILRIKEAAYCPTFAVNIVSFQCLYDQGIRWDTFATPTRLVHKSGSTVCTIERRYRQWVLEYRESTYNSLKAAAAFIARRRRTSKDPRPDAVADGKLWHNRLGHPSPKTLEHLGRRCLGAQLKGPTTVKCDHCGQGKMHRQISRRRPLRPSKPFEEIWIDWTDLTEDYQGYSRVMFITDAYSGLVFPYFLQSHGLGRENRRILRDFLNWINTQYNGKPKVIRSDGELFSKEVRKELKLRSIEPKQSAPNTQAQNGGAERSGGAITEKARTMRIAANLPHNLWKDIVETACYLRNRTPLERNNWQSPFERAFKKPPTISHLRAYGCKAFAMTAEAQLKLQRRRKLEPKAHIGYLVGYQSSNNFRIWIPHKNKVITTRDVIFNETDFFDSSVVQPDLMQSINRLIEEIEIPEAQQVAEAALEDEENEITDLTDEDTSDQEDQRDQENIEDVIVVNTGSQDDPADEDDCENKEERYLPTPPHSDPDFEDSIEAVFNADLPIRHRAGHSEGVNKSGHSPGCCNKRFKSGQTDYRFHEFHPIRVESAVHGAFNAGIKFRAHKRNLPQPPKTKKDLTDHPFRDQFIKAQQEHLASHEKMQSFIEVPWSRAKGQRVLSCMWVFTYKTDRHGYLVRCKARLVVCGNQQEKGVLPTRATTLASMSFRALMAIAAEHDLELEQMDAVNAFVNCDLDETVYMKMPPGYEKYGKVLRLRKALYGLRRSPLLWQRDLTKSLKELGFQIVPQEPCIMTKGSVIVFFFVDDIIWAYRKADSNIAKTAIEELKKKYQMIEMGEPKWFLGIHILRDRPRKTIWLTQDAYIDKVANKFGIDLGKRPATPMALEELLKSTAQATQRSIEQYQQKVGSILFAAISTRPDIAFAVARLARHNLNPSEVHHKAADRVIQYLYATRSFAIRLGSGGSTESTRPAEVFICASDASFADNTEDRKSSQGYVMRLYSGTIAWRASKQATVTTSSTEAELLAASEAAKEMIFAGRLLQALQVKFNEPLLVECDNQQTIRLVSEEATKLTTQLRHVDIHQHWLRQEVQGGRIRVRWVETSKMVADGMTKALPRVRHIEFLKQLQMEDIRNRIAAEALMEEAREDLREKLADRVPERDNRRDLELKLGAKGGRPRTPKRTAL